MTTRHGARCESAEKSSRRMAWGQRARCGTSAPRKTEYSARQFSRSAPSAAREAQTSKQGHLKGGKGEAMEGRGNQGGAQPTARTARPAEKSGDSFRRMVSQVRRRLPPPVGGDDRLIPLRFSGSRLSHHPSLIGQPPARNAVACVRLKV
jgi:hypothetical protein